MACSTTLICNKSVGSANLGPMKKRERKAIATSLDSNKCPKISIYVCWLVYVNGNTVKVKTVCMFRSFFSFSHAFLQAHVRDNKRVKFSAQF